MYLWGKSREKADHTQGIRSYHWLTRNGSSACLSVLQAGPMLPIQAPAYHVHMFLFSQNPSFFYFLFFWYHTGKACSHRKQSHIRSVRAHRQEQIYQNITVASTATKLTWGFTLPACYTSAGTGASVSQNWGGEKGWHCPHPAAFNTSLFYLQTHDLKTWARKKKGNMRIS